MAKYLLDTDIFSKWAVAEEPVSSHIESLPAENVLISVVTLGEVIWGWQDEVHDCPRNELVEIYQCAFRAIQFFKKLTVIPFTEQSLKIFARLRKDFKGYDPEDLHIAAIAIENQFTLVTNNTKDFEPVTKVGLKIANWHKQAPGATR